MKICLFAALLAACAQSAGALLSANFRNFLQAKYGKSFEQLLSRRDLGDRASFGGGNSSKTKNRPIIFVHGIIDTAEEMEKLKVLYMKRGYSENELYATTYGPPGHRTWIDENGKVKCQYVETVRYMIEAVLDYTKWSKVNVIGYSMGVVVSRKAILGGRCVETGKDLGPPLTHWVKNYVGIAGPNYGAFLCNSSISTSAKKPCNPLNGMSCGSKFLNDINAKQHYEGEFVYVIQTIPDSIVGNMVCDAKFTTRIEGADETVNTYDQLHVAVHYLSVPEQYDLLRRNP